MFTKDKNKRIKKKRSLRKKIYGTDSRPRLSVFRSLNQIYAQIINDIDGKTLAAASSLTNEIADDIKNAKTKSEKGKIVGEYLAKLAKDKGIEQVVFDRNGYHYHGRVKEVAEGARKGGLKF